MSEITTAGLDLAKRVASLCGEDAAAGRVVLPRTLRREAALAWFVQRPPALRRGVARQLGYLANLPAATRGR